MGGSRAARGPEAAARGAQGRNSPARNRTSNRSIRRRIALIRLYSTGVGLGSTAQFAHAAINPRRIIRSFAEIVSGADGARAESIHQFRLQPGGGFQGKSFLTDCDTRQPRWVGPAGSHHGRHCQNSNKTLNPSLQAQRSNPSRRNQFCDGLLRFACNDDLNYKKYIKPKASPPYTAPQTHQSSHSGIASRSKRRVGPEGSHHGRHDGGTLRDPPYGCCPPCARIKALVDGWLDGSSFEITIGHGVPWRQPVVTDSYELIFSEEDHRMYEKLHTATGDLSLAVSYSDFILKKGWKAKPWSRGSTYLQQSAFVTAIVTAYGRAFTRSKGWPSLPKEFLDVYDAVENRVHDDIMNKRHKLYAHSDSENYGVRPWKSDFHSDISKFVIFEIDHADICALQVMCRKMISTISVRMGEIKGRYIT